METSSIEARMIEKSKNIKFVSRESKFSIFGNLEVPSVKADNDFDYMVRIVEQMLMVVGSTFPSEVKDILTEAKRRYEFKPVDDTKIYSSEKFVIPPKGLSSYGHRVSQEIDDLEETELSDKKTNQGRTRMEISPDFEAHAIGTSGITAIPNDVYERLANLKYEYLKLIVEKWDTFMPAIQSIMTKQISSNLQSSMLNFDHSLVCMYEFLCIVYDEALDANDEQALVEVMQLSKFYADYYPTYGGFHDLLGVAYYNRNEFKEAIYSWERARECILGSDGNGEKDGEESVQSLENKGYAEKIDSLLISTKLKLGLQEGCAIAETHPEQAMELLKNIKYAFSDWWVFNYYMGVAYQNMNRPKDALKYYETTLEVNSGCHEALERMGEIYTEQEEYVKAYNSLEHSLSINPLNAEAIGMYILASDKVGKLEKGKKLLAKALELSPNNEYVVKAKELIGEKE